MSTRLRSSGRLALALLVGLVFVSLLLLCAFAWWSDLERRLDVFCGSKNWAECSRLVASDITLQRPFVASQRPDQDGPATLLQNYFLELTGGHTQQRLPLKAVPTAEATALIADRAKFYEYQWHLSHLSEAYIRCAVGLYRTRAKAALLSVDTDKQAAAEGLEALAKSLRQLAELYQRHGKYLIAERALKECIDVATQGFALADQKSAERFRAELLVDYGAHIKILNDLGRTPEAEHESKLLLEQ